MFSNIWQLLKTIYFCSDVNVYFHYIYNTVDNWK